MAWNRTGNPAHDYATWQDHCQATHRRRLADGQQLCSACADYFDAEGMKRFHGEVYCTACFFVELGHARIRIRKAAGKTITTIIAAAALFTMPAMAASSSASSDRLVSTAWFVWAVVNILCLVFILHRILRGDK